MKIKEYSQDGIKFISLINDNNFELILSNLGAGIYAIKDGDIFLTLTPQNISDYKLGNIYHGKTIGRVANRIENGVITIDNQKIQLPLNEGKNVLHGGSDGLSHKFFTYSIVDLGNLVKIEFHYLSPHLEGGFPGNIDIKVTYSFYLKDNNLTIEYDAKSDLDTLFALTNHSYFTLNSSQLQGLRLFIASSKIYYPRPTDLIIQKEVEVNKIMDFKNKKEILTDINNFYLMNSRTKGYDHHYLFDGLDDKKVQVSLENDDYQLDISTNFEGCQIYTDNWADNYPFYATNINIRRGIAIEPQDNYLHRQILKKNASYHRFINYNFRKLQ